MRLAKRAMAVALSAAMLVSGLYVGNTASAQSVYDPTADGNHDVYIDASAVPDLGSTGDIAKSDGQIDVRRNVKFQLYCSVDAEWSVASQDTSTESNTYKSVENGDVSVTQGGLVKVNKSAAPGRYTISAKAENVTEVKTASIELRVRNGEDPAKATSISYDADKMPNPQMVVSGGDDKVLTITGKVTKESLGIKFEPEYILDQEVSFDPVSNAEAAYELTTDGKITTKTKTSSSVKLTANVGTGEAKKSVDDLELIIKELDFTRDVVYREGEEDHKTDYDYTLQMNQAVHFDLETNENLTLVGGQQKNITKLTWDVMENDEKLEAVTSKIPGYKAYMVKDKNKQYDVATIYISQDQKEGVDKSEISGRHIYVETEKDTMSKEVNAITLKGTYYLSTDSSPAYIRDLRLRFNTEQLVKADNLYLDFEKAGWISDVNYRKVYDKNVKADVYCFESDGGNLNLSAATFSDNVGVRSFEESKDDYQFSTGGTYKVSYYLSKLPDATFGKEATTKKYTNISLIENETYVNQNDKALLKNDALKKTGTGYFVLTMDAKGEGGESVTVNGGEPYYFRFLSSSNKLKSDFSVRKGNNGEYDLSEAVKEVVHIRQGEAAAPGFFEQNGSEYSSVDEITAWNPYIEYEISDNTIAEEFSDSESKSYRINGLSSGIVTVTAVGAVNKNNAKTFTLYVNKDTMTGEFSLNFTEAEAQNLINTDGVIDGKQNAVPVSVKPITNGFGISNLTWSLKWKDPADNDPDLDSIAVINSKTGVITTKNTSGGKVITVTAVSGENTSSVDFTVGKVEGKSIKTLAEKPSADGSTVLTNTSNNAGTCKVGETFTLYASEYDAPNVTTLSGDTTWTSSDTSKATVDSKGTVTALAETGTTPVTITASYVAEGKAPVDTKFSLTISGFAYSLTGINAADITLDYIGATKAIALSFVPSTVSDREKEVTYSSSDEKVARVSNTGQVTAIGVGTCKITIISAVDSSIQKVITVTVKGAPSTPTQTPPNTLVQNPQQTQTPVNNIPAMGTKVTSAGSSFVVTSASASGGEVTMSKAKNAKTITVPDTVTVSGKKYKVTSIKANAFKGNKKLTSVTIGKNVKSIGKNAFNGCKKLTKVTVKSKVLKSIGKKAFAKGSKKITVTVPKKKAKAYKKLFKKSGISKKAKYKKK